MGNKEDLTVNSVAAELESIDTYEAALLLGRRVKGAIRAGQNTPYLPLDVYERTEDRVKARNFLIGAICS